MRRLDFGRMALCSCVAAAMLAGCGGPQPADRRAGGGAAKPRERSARWPMIDETLSPVQIA